MADPLWIRPEEERRQRARRTAMVIMPYDEGLAFIKTQKYTGPYTVHAHQGEPKRIELPNPEGWRV